MKKLLVVLLLLGSNTVLATSPKSVFIAENINGETITRFEIMATNRLKGVVRNIMKSGAKTYSCLGVFEFNNNVLDIYYPPLGQGRYLGNCHNFSIEFDFHGVKPWRLAVGEEVEVTYKGIMTFSHLRGGTFKRVR